ncbi:fimbrial protein [Pseudomonas protegens]|uniref:fimbrial protein n=1 Tax=Pseudomonas protegens TaxID=380021 RepID=UPI0027496E99|nr:fimbrial protein [Pseudomonas protegens]MDP9532490.1 fimbrial protein [Pseudomonas protegens]
MKRSWWVAALASCLSLAVSNAYAHDVQLNFQGKVTESTCFVDSSQDIKLHAVSVKAFKGVGSTAVNMPIAITVNGCGAAKIAGKFSAIPGDVDLNTRGLINKQPGGSNVQIRVTNLDGEALDLVAGETLKPTVMDAENSTFAYIAQYYAADAIVTAGDVSAKLMFDLVYE